MDKVSIEEVSKKYCQFIIDGPKSFDILQKIGINSPPEKDEFISTMVDNVSMTIIGRPAFGAGSGFHIIILAEQKQRLITIFEDFGVEQLSEESQEILRVESGIPKVDHELTDKYTPLETNLTEAISTTKGCYTGQEVIARQINYDKITKQLASVTLSGTVKPGSAILIDGKKAGELTSFVKSPRFGHIGLAIIKRPHFTVGTKFVIKDNGIEVPGSVVTNF